MILVTGAGGNIGATLIELLKGTPFRAAYNTPSKAAAAIERGLDAVVIDYAKPETLKPALRGVTAVQDRQNPTLPR
jgi:uncharacterized protein YbjT (DUF2867 family)